MEEEPYKSLQKLADATLSDALGDGEDIVGAYISGSFATRSAGADSDLDLTLVSTSLTEDRKSFSYCDGIPLDLKISPKAKYEYPALEQVDSATGMGLYAAALLWDPHGLLAKAQDYVKRWLYTPKHQGRWIEGARTGALGCLKQASARLKESKILEAQILLSTVVVILGHWLGYLSRTPPNVIVNLQRIAEAADMIALPGVVGACERVYGLPESLSDRDILALRESLPGMHEMISSAVVVSGKDDEEREKSSGFESTRPNRWDFVQRKLDGLWRHSREHGYSGLVWSSCDLASRAKSWIPEESPDFGRIISLRDRVLCAAAWDAGMASAHVDRLSVVAEELDKVEPT